MEYSYFNSQIEDLDKQGYLKFAAEPDYFNGIYEQVKKVRPKARCVRGVGEHAIDQYIYLPHGKRVIISICRRQFHQASKSVRNNRLGLKKLGVIV